MYVQQTVSICHISKRMLDEVPCRSCSEVPGHIFATCVASTAIMETPCAVVLALSLQ